MIALGLKEHGYRVEVYGDPVHAINEFKPRHYDIILLDLKVNDMTSFDAAKRIWSMSPDARICFFSAFDIFEKEVRIMFRDFRQVLFVKKPISPGNLARFIPENM